MSQPLTEIVERELVAHEDRKAEAAALGMPREWFEDERDALADRLLRAVETWAESA